MSDNTTDFLFNLLASVTSNVGCLSLTMRAMDVQVLDIADAFLATGKSHLLQQSPRASHDIVLLCATTTLIA